MKILIPLNEWINSYLSIVRHTGGCRVNGKSYVLWGDANDLLEMNYTSLYDKLGREKFIAILEAHPEISSPSQMRKIISEKYA